MMPSEKSDSSKSKANEHPEWILPRLTNICVTTTFSIRIKLFLSTSENSVLKYTSVKQSNLTACTWDSPTSEAVIYSLLT